MRVDSDIVDKLIQKEDSLKMSLSEAQQEIMRPVFESQMPKDEKIHYNISFEAMSPDAAPVVITQNEFMRRMKEMAAAGGGGMSQFYGQMPDNFTIAVNGNHPIVIDILADVEKSYGDKLKTITKKIDAAVAEERRFDEVVKGKKEEELTPEEKSTREELSKKVVTLRDERNERLREIGGENRLVKQIIDLACRQIDFDGRDGGQQREILLDAGLAVVAAHAAYAINLFGHTRIVFSVNEPFHQGIGQQSREQRARRDLHPRIARLAVAGRMYRPRRDEPRCRQQIVDRQPEAHGSRDDRSQVGRQRAASQHLADHQNRRRVGRRSRHEQH